MKTNYVLIDFENVQPQSFELLQPDHFRVYVFLGAAQKKVNVAMANSLQPLGERACYLQITGNGNNALDFHIAYYLGELATKDPKGFFHVVSKDTGFDRLIEHLKKVRKIMVKRSGCLEDIPVLKLSGSVSDRIEAVVKNLVSRGAARPRTVRTLTSTVSAMFGGALEAGELDALVQELAKREWITVEAGKVTYRLDRTA